MNKKQPLQKPKLTYRIIGRSNSLSSFLSSYTYSNMRLHDHADIISPIPNTQCDPFPLTFSQANNICFLFGGYSAADDTSCH